MASLTFRPSIRRFRWEGKQELVHPVKTFLRKRNFLFDKERRNDGRRSRGFMMLKINDWQLQIQKDSSVLLVMK